MIDPNTSSTQLTAMETYAQNAPSEYMIPPGGQPAMEKPEYQNGVVPLDTLPAAWWNWLLYTITEQEKRMVRFFNSIFTEFRNLLTTGGIQSFDETVTNQLVTAIQTIARTPASTLLCGAIKAGTTYGTLAVDQQTGVATVNGAGSGQFNTLAQNITDAINELDGDIGTETNNRTSADNVLQNNIDGKAPINHASTTTTYGKGDDTNYGHVKLSDSYTDATSDKDAGTAVTPKALKDGIDSIMTIQANVPVGSVFPFAASTAPTGYLICDGRAVDRTTYSNLFAVIGVTWGAGDGINTFNIPNLQGRAVMGADTTNTFGSVQADTYKSHGHTASSGSALGDHSHTYSGSTGYTDVSHNHTVYTAGHSGSINTSIAGWYGDSNAAAVTTQSTSINHQHSYSGTTDNTNLSHTHTITVDSSGSTETRPKNLRMNWIIKY